MTKRLAVIDGKSVFYRGYYAMPGLALKDGTPTGGVYGFASLALELIRKLEPDYVAVAWDKPKTNIRKRKELYPEYKAGRKPAPADFYAQIPILHELLEAFSWPLYELDDYEADDILGAFAKQATERGIETILITSDLDALQLVGPLTHVYALKNGLANLEAFDIEHFEHKYGIGVEQFLDLKSLKGDSSDNLPGVPGVGEKTALTLLQEYKTLDGIYEHIDSIKPTIAKKLVAGKELAYLSKELGRIWTDAPATLDWDKADVRDIDVDAVAAILRRLEFHSLLRRLPQHMQVIAEPEQRAQVAAELPGEEAWPEMLDISGPVVMMIEDDTLLLSRDDKHFMRSRVGDVPTSVWRVLELGEVIAYDPKALYHQLADAGVDVRFDSVHDVHQAAFLIDPLARSHELGDIAHMSVETAEERLAALWASFNAQQAVFTREETLARVAHEFDFPLSYVLFKMERRGIKLDSTSLSDMSKQLETEYNELEQEMYTLVGHEFNIGSPKQLSEVLFDTLGLPTQGIKKGKTGYSTGQKELDKLRGLHPIVELIEKTRELAKLKSTYVDTLPQQVDTLGRVHTTYRQDVAATGRLSSTNPNLQNIPVRSELGKRVRDAFVAEGDKVLVSADYSQFELRLAAVLAGDEEMMNDFNGDVDIHIKTASEVYGVPMDDVTKKQRYDAKAINFGVLYGMSPHGLSAATGMSFPQAKKFIDRYFEVRAPIRAYIDGILKQAREQGYVATHYGRRRPTPDILSSNFMVRAGAERAAMNMPIQGTEADLMKRAMIQLEDKLAGRGEQILQVHDSIMVETPREHADAVAEILRETMEGVAPELPIKLRVDISIGQNWGEL